MYIGSVFALIFLVSVNASSLIYFPKAEESKPAPTVLKPLHVVEQNYLDDKENTFAKRQVGEKAKVQATMKDSANGYYEFQIGNNTCKFYVDKRQSERSLWCNAKMCSNKSKEGKINQYWTCDAGTCSIKENLKAAECDLSGGRHVIDAPSRTACPAGQSKVRGECRSGFK